MSRTASAQKRYEALKSERYEYLERARDAAEMTVPHLMPPEGFDSGQRLDQPFSSLGSRGVKNLASKLLLTLFPTTSPFFKYSIDELLIAELTGNPNLRGEIEEALSVRERAIHNEIAATKFRPISFEAIRQLIVSGNYLVHIPKKGGIKGYRLDKYVVSRDDEGTLLEIVIEEAFSKDTLPERAKEIVEAEYKTDDGLKSNDKTIKVYTHVYLDENKYKVYQEVNGTVIPDSEGSYKKDKNEFVALRLSAIPGEDYGRSYVEEFYGDLLSLNTLQQAFVEGSAISARTLFGVEPASATNPRKVAETKNGGFFKGEQGSVWSLQVDKRLDYQTTESMIARLESSLAFSFLLNSAIQRNGERVTAEEIRFMAGEVEDGLGGMYSLLAEEFQLPVVKLFEARMENIRKVPGLPEGSTSPKIVTGLDALGRGQDSRALDELGIAINNMFGPEVAQQYIVPGEWIRRKAAADGVDVNGLIRSEEELQVQQEQQQQQQLLQQLGPNAINQLGPLLQNGVLTEEQPEEPQDDRTDDQPTG